MADMTGAMFTSTTDLWSTPQTFFDQLDAKHRFTLDVCAMSHNAKCATWYGPDHVDVERRDGLVQTWAKDANGGTVWMNPPYGRTIGRWVCKAFEESQNGITVVCLLPARTDTAWFHDCAMRGEVEFVRGRLKFGDATNSAPFPSCVVTFHKEARRG
mgnify:FL=1